MAYDYEALYRTTPGALGAPSQVLVDFFAALAGRALRVLDIGCGQGRDALFIARAGHSVVGLDLAPSGIAALTAAAQAEALDIIGIVADVTTYAPEGMFDIVLIDRTLHMIEEHDRLKVLARLLDHVAPGGWCLIADERRNMAGFKRIATSHRADWTVETDRSGYIFLRHTGAA